MNLYTLTQEYQSLIDAMEESEDASADEGLHEALASISDAIETKAEYLARVIKTLEAEADALKNAADELSKKRKARENRADSIKRFLESALQSVGIDKIKGELFTVAIQQNNPSVLVTDEKSIPNEYWIQQEPKLDRKLLLETIKAGETVRGAEIQRTKSLRIR
jgi:hypothetical protein